MACTLLQQANGQLTSQRPTSVRQRSPVLRPLYKSSFSRLDVHNSFPTSGRAGRVAILRASTEDNAGLAVETVSTPTAAVDSEPEEVFYEGPGSNAELILSLVLLPTLIYAPLSMASIGRRLWISFKFTNKRLAIVNTSPLFKRTIEISYANIKDIRTGPRGFGLWGDMVIFLRDGSRIELTGIEKYKEIEEHINRCIYTL